MSVSSLPSTPSGFRALDEELPGGGWPARCLTELLLSRTGVGEIRFLASTLASLTQAGREIVLLAPPHVPDPTGWEQLGIDMRRVLIVRTPKPADRLWSIEQSLKSSAFGALLAWLPEEKTLARHDALRRLQSVAASANGLTFLLRPAAAQYHASPAPLRLTLGAGRPDGERRTLSVRLLKRRGPVLAQPLTLPLPEVHCGLRVFGLAARAVPAAPSPAASAASSAASARSASMGASHPASTASPLEASGASGLVSARPSLSLPVPSLSSPLSSPLSLPLSLPLSSSVPPLDRPESSPVEWPDEAVVSGITDCDAPVREPIACSA